MIRDPGLQPERTALAWRRSAIVLMVGAIILSATAARERIHAVAIVGAVFAVVAASEALRDPVRRGPGGPWPALVRMVVLGSGLGVLGAATAVAQSLD